MSLSPSTGQTLVLRVTPADLTQPNVRLHVIIEQTRPSRESSSWLVMFPPYTSYDAIEAVCVGLVDGFLVSRYSAVSRLLSSLIRAERVILC